MSVELLNRRPENKDHTEIDFNAATGSMGEDDMGARGEEGCMSTIMRYSLILLGGLLSLIPLFWPFYTKVCNQYERLVHFRLGKLKRPAKGPGIFYFLPCVDSWRTVDLRIRTIDVPKQEMMTKDSVTCSVDAVVYFHVFDPIRAVIIVENHQLAAALLAQTTLRSVIGESELDELLQKREVINQKIRRHMDDATDKWGIKVTAVEVKDVVLPQQMQRAMASQAEAERDRRAKVISAEGELQASRTLLRAADEMTKNPATMQLRYLQTLTEIAGENTSTVVFPLPIELMSLVQKGLGGTPNALPMPQLTAGSSAPSGSQLLTTLAGSGGQHHVSIRDDGKLDPQFH